MQNTPRIIWCDSCLGGKREQCGQITSFQYLSLGCGTCVTPAEYFLHHSLPHLASDILRQCLPMLAEARSSRKNLPEQRADFKNLAKQAFRDATTFASACSVGLSPEAIKAGVEDWFHTEGKQLLLANGVLPEEVDDPEDDAEMEVWLFHVASFIFIYVYIHTHAQQSRKTQNTPEPSTVKQT